MDQQFLKKNLKQLFDSRIFSRGVDYHRSKCVTSLKVFKGKKESNVEIRGEVIGSDDYKTKLFFDWQKQKFYNTDCSCLYGDSCKHSVALGLKFIDLYSDFSGKNKDDFSREELMSCINNQKIALSYDEIDDEENFDEYDDNDWEDDEEEEKEIVNKNKQKSKQVDSNIFSDNQFLKTALEAIGVNTTGISDDILKVLQKNFNINKQVADPQKPLPLNLTTVAFKPSILPITPKQPKQFEPEKFKVIIEYSNSFDFYIARDTNKINANKTLKEYADLTESQKELLEAMKKFQALSWYDRQNIDHVKLFKLIKDSGIKVFIQKMYSYYDVKLQELFFETEPEKIKVELILDKYEDPEHKGAKHEYSFKLDNKYEISGNNKAGKFFYSQDCMVYIIDGKINLYQLSSKLVKIISRIYLNKNYYYDNKDKFLQTKLNEEEIINLNQIIIDAKNYLDLKTELESNYNIKKFEQADHQLVVNYDAEQQLLELRAEINYGCASHDVAQTVFCSKIRNNIFFKRREYKNQDKYVIEINDNNIYYAPLKKDKEIEMYKNFYDKQDLGFTKTAKCLHKGQAQIFNFFEQYWSAVKTLADKKGYKIIYIKDKFDFVFGDFKADFDVDLNAENDWLWFDVACYCGQDKISLEILRQYVDNKSDFIRMTDGKIMRINNYEELERFVMMLESFYKRESGGFEGKLYHAPELENIFTSSKYYNAKTKASFDKFITEAKSGQPVKKVKIPNKFNTILRDYQKEGINWFYFLRQYRFAGILADDMGLGKTLQALVLLEKEKNKDKPSIVICPKTLLYNWQSEAEKFTPDLKTLVIDGSPAERQKMIKDVKKYDLLITGYATMQKDAEIYAKKKIKFNYCILDEAQFIKNHTTKNAQIVKKVDADFRLALTGTPLENSVSEIWSIFDFLMPGFLGSYNNFVKKFQTPIMKNNSAIALDNLRKKIACFMLRRTKKEVLKELPPKIEQVSHCHLEKAQNILYQEILANVKSEIMKTVEEKGFNKSRIHILAGLTKLRQVCNHPVLLLKDKDYTKYESAKLEMFLELIDEIVENKKKVLVFSQFTKMLDILAKELDKKNVGYNYLSGKTKNRQELVNDFNQNDEKRVFLISLKAGGTGLNLTSADNVIIFDPWWNPSVENQAIDRAHRIGQKNSVNVYRLITKGTIEEKIVALQEKKRFLFDNLVGESRDLFMKLTWNDIKSLFD